MKYTIVGIEKTEGQCITEHLEAKNVDSAIKAFFKSRACPQGTEIIDIFSGHHSSLHPSGFAIEYEGK